VARTPHRNSVTRNNDHQHYRCYSKQSIQYISMPCTHQEISKSLKHVMLVLHFSARSACSACTARDNSERKAGGECRTGKNAFMICRFRDETTKIVSRFDLMLGTRVLGECVILCTRIVCGIVSPSPRPTASCSRCCGGDVAKCRKVGGA